MRATVVLFRPAIRKVVNFALQDITAFHLKVVVHPAMPVLTHLEVAVPIATLARSCTLQTLGRHRAI